MNIEKVIIMLDEVVQECSNLPPSLKQDAVVMQDYLNAVTHLKLLLEGHLAAKKGSYEDLSQLIETWAEDKGLFEPPKPMVQFCKCVSEVGELADHIAMRDVEASKDDIGDIEVTLIILKKQLGFAPTECLEHAYSIIKNRKGTTTNGVFVKEGGGE